MSQSPALIDTYLPHFDHREFHQITIDKEIEAVYPLVRHLDFNRSWMTRRLFKLRGMPFEDLTLDAMIKPSAFGLLAEAPPEQFVLGLLGGASGQIPIESGEQFRVYSAEQGIKIAWDFRLTPTGVGQTVVSTETRVLSFGSAAKRRFSVYWFFVRPFSGLIRKEMLRIIRLQAA